MDHGLAAALAGNNCRRLPRTAAAKGFAAVVGPSLKGGVLNDECRTPWPVADFRSSGTGSGTGPDLVSTSPTPNQRIRHERAAEVSATITDHAVLRFLERAYGLGAIITAAREEMASGAQPAIDFSAPFALVHNCRLVIVDGRVITTKPTGKRRTRNHKAEGARA